MTDIVQVPNEVLTIDTFGVTDFDVHEIAHLLLDALEADETAVGVAAPQIGITAPMAVVAIPDREHRFVMVNPRIVTSSKKTDPAFEGCLSLEGRQYIVDSPINVTVEWEDVDGRSMRRAFSHFHARVMRHEIDHLHGITIADHGVEVNVPEGAEHGLFKSNI